MDQLWVCRIFNDIDTSQIGCGGLPLERWLGPTASQETSFSDTDSTAPVLPRNLCTFRDQLIALFVIAHTGTSALPMTYPRGT